MRNANTILNIIRKRGQRQLPISRVYRLLYQPEFYLRAYGKLARNQGALTPGVTLETVDGMSLEKIAKIIQALRAERYQWTPVRRTYIPKKNGKLRPLSMPSWSDKLLQEVIRSILEAYYEPQFSDCSHGFRPKRGCHTALLRVAQKGRGTKWFIEGDLRACFDKIDHSILLNILREKFHDNRFIRLIERLLKAGYLEDWKYNQTYSGVPQGSIVSPILSNLVLDRLDKYVESELIPQYTQGKRRRANPPYVRLTWDASDARKSGDLSTARQLSQQAQRIPSRDPNDPNFRRLWYTRYADDFLLGLVGSKSEAVEIKQKIANFLGEQLHLELNKDKTLVTHARCGQANFLGYDIHVLHANDKHDHRGQRCINGSVGLRVPKNVISSHCAKYMRPLVTHFGGVSLKWNKWVAINDEQQSRIWNGRSEVVQRLLAQECELCGSQSNIEVHHIRKLADLEPTGRKPRPEWMKKMSARRRKTLVVCRNCHHNIQYGRYDGHALKRKNYWKAT